MLNPCIGESIHCKMKCVRNWEKSLQGKSQELQTCKAKKTQGEISAVDTQLQCKWQPAGEGRSWFPHGQPPSGSCAPGAFVSHRAAMGHRITDHLGWKQPSRPSQPSRSRSSPTIKLTYCVPLLRHIHTSLKCPQAKGFRHSLGSPF